MNPSSRFHLSFNLGYPNSYDRSLGRTGSALMVHVFPFRMTPENMHRHQVSRWAQFWENLKEGYDWFERTDRPPNVEVVNKRYVFDGS